MQDLDTGAGYLKAGFLGLAGSGKTFTATELAIGTRAFLKLDGPIAMADSEGGSVYVAPRVREATGKKLVGIRSRSLDDAKKFLRDCVAEGVSVAIVDSVTHYWREVCETYLARLNAARERRRLAPLGALEFAHWNAIKSSSMWGEFSDMFLTLPLHIIVCGREGYEYAFEQRDDGSGKKDLVKTSVKMKTESEFGYEPSLLVRMEQEQTMDSGELVGIARCATVLKDRFNRLDGKTASFSPTDRDGATFDFFRPHLELLTPGAQSAVDVSRRSDVVVNEEGSTEWHKEKRDREVLCEEIAAALDMAGLGGTSSEAKLRRPKLLEDCFGTASKTKLENTRADVLREGLAKLRIRIGETKEGAVNG